MANDFIVVFNERLHFGSHPNCFDDEAVYGVERLAPGIRFVGAKKAISFDVPKIDVRQAAVLMYQSFDVTLPRNIITINGTELPGGIPVSSRRGEWKSNICVLEPGSLIMDQANQLIIEAHGETDDPESNCDNFILTSAVLMYKTTV